MNKNECDFLDKMYTHVFNRRQFTWKTSISQCILKTFISVVNRLEKDY